MDITYSLEGFWRVIKNDRNSRKIFILLSINFTFTFIEFIYGVLGNSLSLISDSAHMLFDASALAIGLYAAFMAKLKPDSRYTYGYARFQVLSGFINAIFLMFVAFSIFNEALERMIEPQFVNSRQIILVSVTGFIINIIGLCFFHEHSHFIEHYENDATIEEVNEINVKPIKNDKQHEDHENDHLCNEHKHNDKKVNTQTHEPKHDTHKHKHDEHDDDSHKHTDNIEKEHFHEHNKNEDNHLEDHKQEDGLIQHHMHDHDHHHNENLYGIFM